MAPSLGNNSRNQPIQATIHLALSLQKVEITFKWWKRMSFKFYEPFRPLFVSFGGSFFDMAKIAFIGDKLAYGTFPSQSSIMVIPMLQISTF